MARTSVFPAWDSAGNGAFTQPVMLNMLK